MGSEAACPFCGASLRSTRAPLGSLGLAIGLMTAACGPGTAVDEGGGSETVESSGTPGTTSTSTATSTATTTASTSATTMGPETTTGITSTPVDSSSDDQGGSFYAGPPDGPNLPDCDLLAQDCPKGEKCMPWANDGGTFHNDVRCTPISPGAGQDGEPCLVEGTPYSGVDDCDLGLVCAEVGPAANTGVCRALCDPDGVIPCTDPDLSCVGWYDGGLPICSPSCDPLLDECGPGLGCFGEPDIVCDAAQCGYSFPDGAGQQGDPCTWPNMCEAGLQCTDAALVPGCAGGRCCTLVCDLTDLGSCDAVPGTICNEIADPGSCGIQALDTGVCITP